MFIMADNVTSLLYYTDLLWKYTMAYEQQIENDVIFRIQSYGVGRRFLDYDLRTSLKYFPHVDHYNGTGRHGELGRQQIFHSFACMGINQTTYCCQYK